MNRNLNSLKTNIEKIRIEMINLAHQYGYCNPNVIQCSQRLDSLLNVYNHTRIE